MVGKIEAGLLVLVKLSYFWVFVVSHNQLLFY